MSTLCYFKTFRFEARRAQGKSWKSRMIGSSLNKKLEFGILHNSKVEGDLHLFQFGIINILMRPTPEVLGARDMSGNSRAISGSLNKELEFGLFV